MTRQSERETCLHQTIPIAIVFLNRCPRMNGTPHRPHRRLLGFILLVIGAAVILSAKTGIVVPARWFGLFYWTCALLWFVFRQLWWEHEIAR
jgi:hypothetical protein